MELSEVHRWYVTMLFFTKHESNLILLSCSYKCMSCCLHFPNNLKDIKFKRHKRHRRPYIGLYDRLQNIFPIKVNSFQRKPKLIGTLYILQ